MSWNSEAQPMSSMPASRPSARNALTALGVRLTPAPISLSTDACSQTMTSAPRRSSASAAAKPPMPPPTMAMRGVRGMRGSSPSFVIAGLDPAIHAEGVLGLDIRSSRTAPLLSMDTRVKPADDARFPYGNLLMENSRIFRRPAMPPASPHRRHRPTRERPMSMTGNGDSRRMPRRAHLGYTPLIGSRGVDRHTRNAAYF